MSKQSRRRWVPVLGGVVLVLAALYLQARNVDFTQRIEAMAYDLRLHTSLSHRPDPRIVIVDIDEKSLGAEGHWPWPRDRLARLVDKLFTAGSAVVAFDMVFAESDESSAAGFLEEFARSSGRPDLNAAVHVLREQASRDAVFAKSLQARPVVLGYVFDVRRNNTGTTGALPPPLSLATPLQGKNIRFVSAHGYSANLAALQQSAAGGGYFITQPDVDGNLRRVPLLMQYGKRLYGALSLEILRVYSGASGGGGAVDVELHDFGFGNGAGIERLRVGRFSVPTDRDGQVLIPFRGPQDSFPYLSATDVLHDRVQNSRLAGKIVLVGTTAAGLNDLRATPVQEDYPGVETHASIVSAALDTAADAAAPRHRFLQRPSWAPGLDFVVLLAVGFGLALSLPRLTLFRATAAMLGTVAGTLAVNFAMWFNAVVLALAIPLLLILSLYVFNMLYGYFFEARSRRALMHTFGQYVPPALVDEMSARPGNFGLEGESREMTVLFADIRGFTAIAEQLAPTELKRLLNAFLTPMTAAIHRHRGTIDKYVGDMIMAFWGAPLADAQHARHALDAAMEMLNVETQLRAQFLRDGLPPIAIGVGINTGTMNVGNMGSTFRMAYTVIGDAVNVASRLEALTRRYGARIIVSESTKLQHDGLVYRELDRVCVKGKREAVTLYEPLAYIDALGTDVHPELALYNRALKLYRERQWDLAELQFLQLAQRQPRALYNLYVERIQQFRAHPPAADWTGVFDYTDKR